MRSVGGDCLEEKIAYSQKTVKYDFFQRACLEAGAS